MAPPPGPGSPVDARPPRVSRRRADDPRPSAMNRYLLESERLVFAVRRHSAVLAGSASIYLLLLFVAVVLLVFAGGSDVIATTGLLVLLAASAWFAWKVGDWWVERFTVTDRRVLLVSGLLTRRVAIMPLRKVTDLTFERSVLGRLFGFGAFVMESAGQQQALSRIDFLPRPESLYLQMSDLLFGTGEADHDPDEDPRPRSARSARPSRSRDPERRRPGDRPARPARSADPPYPPGPASPGGSADGPGATEGAGATVSLGRAGSPRGPRVTSRPPDLPPRVAAPPGVPPPPPASPVPGATTPLPSIAGSRPLARRPRGRLDPTATDPTAVDAAARLPSGATPRRCPAADGCPARSGPVRPDGLGLRRAHRPPHPLERVRRHRHPGGVGRGGVAGRRRRPGDHRPRQHDGLGAGPRGVAGRT